MPTAFQAQPIVEFKQREKSRIESLAACDDRVIVGLVSGTLRVYKLNEEQEPGDANQHVVAATPTSTRLLHEDDKFGKRPVTQLAVIEKPGILVSLSDGHVSFHDLQTYKFRERLEKTKGASTFAVTSDVSGLVSRLAVAVKRRILLWVWQGEESVVQAKEIALQSTIKSLTWVSDTKMIVGMDPGFTLLDVVDEHCTDILKPDAAGEATVQTGGSRFGAVNTTGMGYVGLGGWAPRPMATKLADGRALLAKDVNTLFVDGSGRALERRQIPWSFPPDALDFCYPFLLSLQQPAKGILDVRNPDTQSLFQSIPVPNATLLHVSQDSNSARDTGKGFLVASDRCVWRMLPVKFESQIDELVDLARFDEAISLLDLLDDTLLTDKPGLVREVQIKKAKLLFKQRKYQPALDLLADAGAPPAKVIALYPETVAGPLAEDVETSEPVPPTEPADTESHATETATRLKETHEAILSTSQDTDLLPDSSRSELGSTQFDNSEELKKAVVALCGFLAQSRVQIQKFINNDGFLRTSVTIEQHSDAYAVPFKNLIPFDRDADLSRVDWQAELYRVANLVDTTLFRAYMYARPQLAGPLFRLDNFCDPHVVEEKLYASGRYTDLIDFLRGKKLHRQALELLEKFGRNDAAEEVMPALRGPGRTVSYLQQLQSGDIDLILEFAKWPLEVQSDLGMEVFLADTENAERLPRGRVLDFLKSVDSTLATTYLEHIVKELDDQDPDFHQGLVETYITQLSSSTTKLDHAARRKKLQTNLEDFLRASKQYNKGRTFRQLPANAPDFYESRAIVLSAMGNHKQALSIYVFQLQDYDKAEAYCDEIHLSQQLLSNPTQESGNGDSSGVVDTAEPHSTPTEEIYSILLGLYLQPPQDAKVNWSPALKLLHNHGARIPAGETLSLAPDDLAVAELQLYFKGRIRRDVVELNTGRVLVGLGRCLRERAERELVGVGIGTAEIGIGVGAGAGVGGSGDARSAIDTTRISGLHHPGAKRQGRNRRVVIRPDSHCKVCLRRFGNAAVRVFPDDQVVHYGCAAGAGGGSTSASGAGSGSGSGPGSGHVQR